MDAWIEWLASCVCGGDDDGVFSALIGGRAAFCARCSGVYIGVLIGLAVALTVRWRRASMPPPWLFALQIGSIAVMAASGFAGLYGLIDLSPWAKFAIGAFFGHTLGAIAGEVIKTWAGCRAPGTWTMRDVAAYIVSGIGAAGLPGLMRRVPRGAGIVTFSSALGVLVALAAANAVVILAATRAAGRKMRWSSIRIAAIVLACAVELLLLRAWRGWWRG